MATEEEKILSIKVDYADAIKAIADYKQKIDDLKTSEQELKDQLKNGEISRQQYNESIAASKIVTQQYNEAVRVLNKEVANSIKSDKSKDTSLKGLRAALSNVTAEYDALSREERNSAKGKELQKHINGITNELKAAEEGTQRYYRNVGNYLGSLDGSFKGLASTIIQFGQDTKQSFALATAGANGTSKAMNILKVAIASTGIGLLVVAVGSLAAAFSRTQRGMETFQRISTMIGTTIDVVLDRLAMLGDAVVKVFQGDFKGAAESARGAISGIGEEIKEEVAQADKLRQALIQIEKEETQLAITRSKNRAEIERLKQIAEDTSRAEEERLAAAQRAYAIEQADMQKQIKLQERRLANMLGEVEVTEKVRNVIDGLNSGRMKADEAISMLGLSESTMADFQQFADEVVKLNELQESSLTRQIEMNNKINNLKADTNKADKELVELKEKTKDDSNLSDDEFKKEYERQRRLAQARLEASESVSQEELNLKLKLNELEMNEELRQIKDDEELKLAIREEYRAKNDALTKAFNESQIQEQQERADKEVEIEQAKLQAMSQVMGSLVSLIEAVGESSKAAAIASKVIALAQIAIDTGAAIASGVAQATKIGFPQNLAAIATTVATVIANMATAIKTVKRAKFSTGGDVSGEGTATSDSIPAMLSDGESVLTAKATSMFAPILSAFNQAGGGVPIYGQQTGSKAQGEDMLAKSFAKGLANMPAPQVAVTEIQAVQNRVKVIENINRI